MVSMMAIVMEMYSDLGMVIGREKQMVKQKHWVKVMAKLMDLPKEILMVKPRVIQKDSLMHLVTNLDSVKEKPMAKSKR